MQRDASNYLEYQPNLEYVKDKTPVTSSGAGSAPIAGARPVTPTALTKLKERPSSAVLQDLQNTLDAIKDALADATKDLVHDTANGISFPEYLEARKQDPVKAKAYETGHQDNIMGSPAMDIVPALLDAQDELNGLKDLLTDRFYDGKAPRNIEDTKKQEMDQANVLISMANAGKDIPLDQVRMDNTLRGVISDRVSNVADFVEQAAATLKTGLSDDTGGRPTVAVQALLATGDLLTPIEDLNKLNFDKQQENFATQSQRTNRLTPVAMRVGLPAQLSNLQQQALKYKTVVDHLAASGITNEHPAAIILENTLTGLKKIHDALRTASVDAYKLNLLQAQQGQSFLKAVSGKRRARQVHQLIGDVKRHYDPSGPVGLQVKRIADLQSRK